MPHRSRYAHPPAVCPHEDRVSVPFASTLRTIDCESTKCEDSSDWELGTRREKGEGARETEDWTTGEQRDPMGAQRIFCRAWGRSWGGGGGGSWRAGGMWGDVFAIGRSNIQRRAGGGAACVPFLIPNGEWPMGQWLRVACRQQTKGRPKKN
jgi:hypothetical protein